jgi:hypothetical protein
MSSQSNALPVSITCASCRWQTTSRANKATARGTQRDLGETRQRRLVPWRVRDVRAKALRQDCVRSRAMFTPSPELAVNTPFPRSTFRTSDFQCPPNRKAANHRPPNRTGRREPPPPIYPCSELRPPTSDLLLGARNGLTIGREQTDPCRSSRWRLWVLMVFPESALACVEEAQHPRPPSWLHRESHRSPFASHRIASQPGRAACPARAALCSRTEASIERAAKALKVEGVKHYTDMHALFAGVWRC